MSDDYIKGFTLNYDSIEALIRGQSSMRNLMARPVPRGFTAFEIQQTIAEAQSKLSDVQRAFRPRSKVLEIEQLIEYMFQNPLCFNADLYVDLRWQLAKARMHEDLDRIIMKHRYERAIETGVMDVGVDMARPGTDRTSVTMWADVAMWPDRPPRRLL